MPSFNNTMSHLRTLIQPWTSPLAVGTLLVFSPPSGQVGAQTNPYWQQEVHYNIEASLDDVSGVLSGAGTMVYRNRSPDALDRVEFHLHLNAFRPNSAWANAEQRPQYNFQALSDPDHAYARLTSMRLEGVELEAEYPFSPDSTVVRYRLPRELTSGEDATFSFEWRARPSTLCRRQCRAGRSHDFAQWYPRIAPYDHDGWQGHPLYPQGEFYGEYGVWDVTLDLAADQVVGATGVVIEGDPGWEPAPDSPERQVRYRAEAYEPLESASPGFLGATVGEGRKRVRFYAEDVHHFAWSTSPDYLYEAGLHNDIAVHVLFRPGDIDWSAGAVVNRSIRALDWLEGIFGPYPYPQITNLHRLEGGGTEFPMLIMDGSDGQSLIVHERAHQWAMGILGSNEWKDAYLDEGMASFLTNWFMEEVGGLDPWPATLRSVGAAEGAQGIPVPIATPSEEMPGFGSYGLLAYARPSIVFYMLREMIGRETMRDGLRLYAERKSFEHVVADDLRDALEDAAGTDLVWFFDQWFHSTATLDYAVGEVEVTSTADGWRTAVTVERLGDAWMPLTIAIGDDEVRTAGADRIQVIEVESDQRPEVVEIDPHFAVLESDRTNNRKVIG